MKLRIVFALALVAVGCATTPAARDGIWEEGGFRVNFTQKPTPNHQHVDTDAGPVDVRMFVTEIKSVALLAAYNDYSEEAIAQGTDEQRFDGARDGAVSNTNGTLVRESSIEIKGVKGREFVVATEDRVNLLVWRVFFVGNRLFQVGGVVPPDQEDNPTLQAFFESLDWVKP